MYFWDLKRAVSKLYDLTRPKMSEDEEAVSGNSTPQATDGTGTAEGSTPDVSKKDSWEYTPCTFVLDHALRIVATIPFAGEPAAHLDEALGVVDSLPAIDSISTPAPVLTVPYVFEPELCRDLIQYYETRGGADSGFMRDVDGKTVPILDYSHKRRMDCEITDESLIRATQERLRWRIVPAIKQAFQFDATRIERHIVACYDAADGGHFRAHRDNTTLGTAHRRFAVTMNLNAEEFDGGELWFPEFGPRKYKATTGGAVVFSCSLLHEATPVTRGRRFAFLPFLYDDAAAQIRQRNAKHVSQGPPLKAGT
jgi:predicted 2-oxoglutarate/Fe(II)-dependent dioxygenase YbiX